MRRPALLLLLIAIAAANSPSQSGRRIARPAPTTPTPAAETAEPEREREPITTGSLVFLPERIREREIKMLDRGSFRLADFEGKVLVINMWASWCGPCRREVPEYEKVRKAYANRDVVFIGLTTEDPRVASERVAQFLRDVSFGFQLGWADADIKRALMSGKSGIPQTIVFGADNRVVDHWTGYSPSQSGKRLTQTIEHALLTATGNVISQ